MAWTLPKQALQDFEPAKAGLFRLTQVHVHHIPNPTGDRIDIPAGAVFENKVVSGNIRILDH